MTAAAPPTAQNRQLALAVVIATVLAYAAVIPFAAIPLPRSNSFIPTVFAVIFMADLVTTVLIYAQFSATGSRALLVLASCYFFSSLMAAGHVLTFPGAFAPTGLLGAGPQTAAWLNVLWRLGLISSMTLYAVLRSAERSSNAVESPRSVILWSVAIVVVVACALIAAVIAGHELLPPVTASTTMLPLGHYVNGFLALTNVLAILLLLVLTRGRSILDLWLIVAAFALLAEATMLALFVPARFSLGFYAIRFISLPVTNVVLVVLLWETMRLYAKLSISNRDLLRERANRLTSAEAVAASIAHEIRHPLTDINLLAFEGQRLLDQASPDVRAAKKHFEEIEEGAFRANEVFDGVLRFFRGGKSERQAVDVNALTLEAMHLLRRDLDDHNVTISTNWASDLPVVQGHAGQLREVILNLIQNANDAMAATTDKPRVISIATSRLGAGAISISMQDTGPGIEPQELARIFDPFVTTKAKGTGLGLAICKMIVEQHGGELSAASGETGGARFEITLPTRSAEPVGLARVRRKSATASSRSAETDGDQDALSP